MEAQASLTAVTAARGRAAHAILDGEPKIFCDDFALQFSGADSEASFREQLDATFRDAALKGAAGAGEKSFQAARASMILRSRYTEDALSQAIARGISHYLILGAGLDSFAWRRPDLAKTIKVFEVDHAASQQWKTQRLRDLGIGQPPNLTYLPIDFERQTLLQALREGGFPLNEPAFISWLGVTQYLTREAVLGTLKQVATFASETEISFTFMVPQSLWPTESQRMFPMALASVAAAGEPWISFFEPGELASRLEELGFHRIEHLDPTEANERYFGGRRDGLRVTSGEHLMRVRLK